MRKEYIAPIGDQGLYILNTGTWRTERPVLNNDKCVACGRCYLFCPVNSVRFSEGRYSIDLSFCKGCGICAQECKVKAILMEGEAEADE